MKISVILLRALLISVLFIGIVLIFFLFQYSYEDWVSYILSVTDKEAWRNYFEQAVFPENRFDVLRFLLPVFFVGYSFLLYFLWNYTEGLACKLQHFIRHIGALLQKLVDTYRSIRGLELSFFLVLLVFFIGRSCWNIEAFALQYDEAWTYNHFVSKGALISALSPNNNHVLYTIIAAWFRYLPLPLHWILRLPVLFAGTSALLIAYAFLRRYFGARIALFVGAWLFFSPAFCFYTLYARGYMFAILFAILSTWQICRMVFFKENRTRSEWGILGLFYVLGLYSVPTFLYALLPLSLCLVLGCKTSAYLKAWFVLHIAVVGVASLLYAPLLVTNGASFLFNAATATAVQKPTLAFYTNRMVDWWFMGQYINGGMQWGLLVTLIVFAFLLWNQRASKLAFIGFLSYGILIFPFINGLLGQTHTPFRAWSFVPFFIALFVGFLLKSYQKKLPFYAFLLTLSLGFFGSQTHWFLNWSAWMDKDARQLAYEMQAQNIKSCYHFSHYYNPILSAYYRVEGKVLKQALYDSVSKKYKPMEACKDWDILLWDRQIVKLSELDKQFIKMNFPYKVYVSARVVAFAKRPFQEKG